MWLRFCCGMPALRLNAAAAAAAAAQQLCRMEMQQRQLLLHQQQQQQQKQKRAWIFCLWRHTVTHRCLHSFYFRCTYSCSSSSSSSCVGAGQQQKISCCLLLLLQFRGPPEGQENGWPSQQRSLEGQIINAEQDSITYKL